MTSARLREVLDEARGLGYLGPGDPARHLRHAGGFVAVAGRRLGRPPARFVDLGTGGGVPGLVMAEAWPSAVGFLIDSSRRRCASLRRWLVDLDRDGSVTVLEGRAEDLAHDPELREAADLVMARGFAPPPATAEVGSGFLVPGGLLVVSDPPGGEPSRWPAEPLAHLGFGEVVIETAAGAAYATIRKLSPALPTVPRRRGRPWKRPLW